MATERSATFLDMDVLTAAKMRVRHVFKVYDHVIVSFSGGKDSMAVAHLVRTVLDEDGKQDVPVRLMFRDEEIIPDPVIDMVQSYHDRPGFDLYYQAVPMKSHLFMMGEHWPYVQWDETRQWIRPKPSYAISQVHPQNVPIDQHEMNGLTVKAMGLRGKVAILNGIRAGESLTRLRSVMINKGPYPYISGDPAGARNIDFVKPIYDWNETDLFKFFKEAGVEYASIYNMQMWAGHPLRVATPLHDRAYQSIVKMREMYPMFYNQILSIWPEVATHERYWKDVDRWGIINKYPKSWDGILQYITENITTEGTREIAIKIVKQCRNMREKNRRLGKFSQTETFGFPLLYVFREIVGGQFFKGVVAKPQVSPDELEYEAAAVAEAEGIRVDMAAGGFGSDRE